ncbi:hypothetical protein [Amorphus orientalis]|uniref:DUF2190 domain-containing protein n=1 Tax=Amorphus orientalis TaxID=649198 RepID=A0AAE3VTW9_9HYPH|nr:hypothetical protein [Amorphus orientalis]MDQ0317733.1 hypothetical protein [Amorphus orientalis]
MTVSIAAAAAMAACDAINGFIDAGASAGTLVIYEGTRPASVATAIGAQTALVTLTLGDPAFAAAVDTTAGGHATANPVDPVQAGASGTAQFFRIFDGDGDAVIDGDVTDTAGNGDLKLSSTAVVAGIDVTVVSLTTTMPKSAA